VRYKILDNFKVKTSKGELELQAGQVITLPKDKAISLLNEGKITLIDKEPYKVYSEILQAYLWVVETDQDMHSLRSNGVTEAIYTHDEIRELKNMGKDSLKEIHKVKEVFENSKIIEVNKKVF